jgi:Tfp pilus assembly protein PilP
MKIAISLCLLLLTAPVLYGAKNPFTPLPLPIQKPPKKESLTDYLFNELELKAVIWGIDASAALFQANDGKSFIAKVGTSVGKNGGKITKIDDKIVIIQGDFGKKVFTIRGH